MSRVFIVFGLGFGDEGKGTIVDWLCRTFGAKLAIRYGGGPQAAHNVVTDDGRSHCFAQLASGLLVPDVSAVLNQAMLIEPDNLRVEADVLEQKGVANPLRRTTVDSECTVITPMHKMVGQMMEIGRGSERLGSCGMGVGQAVMDRENGLAVTIREILDRQAGEKLRLIHEIKMAEARQLLRASPTAEMKETYEYFRRRSDRRCLEANMVAACHEADMRPMANTTDLIKSALMTGKTMVFEGAQGALLDRRYGFWPYITKTRTTCEHALDLVAGGIHGSETIKVGVIRAFATRHGAGPFVTEERRLATSLDDKFNPMNRWQGRFRVGWFDLVAARYGLAINDGADWLALTNLDRLSGFDEIRVCTSYRYNGPFYALDRYFEWQPQNKHTAEITAFRKPSIITEHVSDELARILFRCRPSSYVKLPGWRKDICGIRAFDRLPSQASRYILFLQEQLQTPIKIVSVNPRAHGKIFLL